MIFTGDSAAAKKAANDIWRYVNQSTYGDPSARELSRLYATSVYAYAAANFWARAVAGATFIVQKDGEPLPDDDPLQQLFAKSNQLMYRVDLTRFFFGKVMLIKQRNAQQQPYGLRWVNPNIYYPKKTSDGIAGFYLTSSGYNYEQFEQREYKLHDTVFMHNVDFDDDYDGIAPIEVAFLQASAEVEAGQTVLSYFKNRAIPAAIFQPAQGEMRTEAEAETLLGLLRKVTKGAINAGRSVVLPRRWELQTIQPDYEKLTMSTVYADVRSMICTAADLPESFLTANVSNFAELDGQMRNWYQTSLPSVLGWYAEVFTEQFVREYGYDYAVTYDISRYMPEDENARIEMVQRKVDGGLMTLYEAQEQLGHTPDENLRGIYVLRDGTPIPSSEIANVWKYKFSVHESVLSDMSQVTSPEPILIEAGKSHDEHCTCIACTVEAEVVDTASARALLKSEGAFIPDGQYSELQNWERLIERRGEDYAFKANALSDGVVQFVEWGLSTDASIPTVFTAAEALLRGLRDNLHDSYEAVKRHEQRGSKAIQATRSRFEDRFADVLTEARDGNLTQRRFTTLLQSLIEVNGRSAMLDGLIDGGVEDAILTDDDRGAFDEEMTRQRRFAREFSRSIFKDGKVTDAEAKNKPVQWFNGSIMPFYNLGLLRAGNDPNEEWVMNAFKENCLSCIQLNGQVHRRSSWLAKGIAPNADILICGPGKQCGCKLVPTKARARGRFLSKTRQRSM